MKKTFRFIVAIILAVLMYIPMLFIGTIYLAECYIRGFISGIKGGNIEAKDMVTYSWIILWGRFVDYITDLCL